VQSRLPAGHIRTPFYLRGKSGEVLRVYGEFLDAERLAVGGTGLPAVAVYQVAFDWDDLWPYASGRSKGVRVLADLQENWLDPEHEQMQESSS
jgi:hypothetical protein